MLCCELAAEFERAYMRTHLRPTTISGYLVNLNNHALPILGGIPAEALTVHDLDNLTEALTEKGLSNKSIVYVHATVRKMLNFAMKREYIPRNPYALFDLPRIRRYTYTIAPPQQLRDMLDKSLREDMQLHAAITLAGCYGLRRGEVLGLIPVKDFNSQSGILTISRTLAIVNRQETITPCKTDNSLRSILIAPRHRYIFTIAHGKSRRLIEYPPAMLDRYFKDFLHRHGYPDMRFHDLRHSYATWMLDKNVNPKIVSAVLGHSDVSVTLDIYSHPNVKMQQACLDAMEE